MTEFVPLLASHWVNPDLYQPLLKSERPYDLIMVASWGKVKRHQVLFRALRSLPTNLRVLLVGQDQEGRTADTIRELARGYGVADRLELVPADMFNDPVPAADAMLVSNILHDWDVPECRALVNRCAAALASGGRLLIHDVFLNDSHDGPLPIALYSAALFTLTEGRAYSAAEYRTWVKTAGLVPGEIEPTLIHCGVLTSTKR